jgi:hypothetical protein
VKNPSRHEIMLDDFLHVSPETLFKAVEPFEILAEWLEDHVKPGFPKWPLLFANKGSTIDG